MPKPPVRSPERTSGASKRAQPRDRRYAREPGERALARPVAVGSEVMRLAAELEALKAKLSAARAKAKALAAKADVDPLTDILNRRGFARELKRSIAYLKRYGGGAALLYIDLDAFKPINDHHGHGAGDAVLKAVAATIARHVRASDVVARVGGDEFAVLLWNLSAVDATTKAEALERVIASTAIERGRAVLSVAASAGVTMLNVHDDPAAVVERADRAMYARKAARARGTRRPAAQPPRNTAIPLLTR